jgi:3-oxoadipate enol-lactonase
MGARVGTAVPAKQGRVATPDGNIEYLVEGEGDPVTVIGHGLTRTIADTRPLVRGVKGSSVFFHFRSHGNSSHAVGPWSYSALAAELGAVCKHFGAGRAIAISVSCGVLARAVTQSPDLFERLVFVLPPSCFNAKMVANDLIHEYLALAAAGKSDELTAMVASSWPAWMREFDHKSLLSRLTADRLIASPTVVGGTRHMVRSPAIADLTELAGIRAATLIVGQEDDLLHPVQVARELAAAIPEAHLRLIQPVRSYSAYGRAVSTVVSAFLNGEAREGRFMADAGVASGSRPPQTCAADL